MLSAASPRPPSPDFHQLAWELMRQLFPHRTDGLLRVWLHRRAAGTDVDEAIQLMPIPAPERMGDAMEDNHLRRSRTLWELVHEHRSPLLLQLAPGKMEVSSLKTGKILPKPRPRSLTDVTARHLLLQPLPDGPDGGYRLLMVIEANLNEASAERQARSYLIDLPRLIDLQRMERLLSAPAIRRIPSQMEKCMATAGGWPEGGPAPSLGPILRFLDTLAEGSVPLLIVGSDVQLAQKLGALCHLRSKRKGTYKIWDPATVDPAQLAAGLLGRQGVLSQLRAVDTLFIDDPSQLPAWLQLDLAQRMLQQHPPGPRILARCPTVPGGSEGMQEELRHLFSAFFLPSLRDRPDDLLRWAYHFAGRPLSPATEKEVLAAPWPGDLHQLSSTMRAAGLLAKEALSEWVEPQHLYPDLSPQKPTPAAPTVPSLREELGRVAARILQDLRPEDALDADKLLHALVLVQAERDDHALLALLKGNRARELKKAKERLREWEARLPPIPPSSSGLS